MSAKSLKRNFGYLLAGAILFAVAVNVYFETKSVARGPQECRYSLIP